MPAVSVREKDAAAKLYQIGNRGERLQQRRQPSLPARCQILELLATLLDRIGMHTGWTLELIELRRMSCRPRKV